MQAMCARCFGSRRLHRSIPAFAGMTLAVLSIAR